MPPTPEPATRDSLKGMRIVLMVVALLALGLNLWLMLVRKSAPWSEALRDPLTLSPAGMMFLAWSGLLPAAKTGARRILMGLACVFILAGVVLAGLDYFRL